MTTDQREPLVAAFTEAITRLVQNAAEQQLPAQFVVAALQAMLVQCLEGQPLRIKIGVVRRFARAVLGEFDEEHFLEAFYDLPWQPVSRAKHQIPIEENSDGPQR